MAISQWMQQRWRLIPLAPEDWEKLNSFFFFGSYGHNTIQKLRRINNAELEVDWMRGGAETKISGMNQQLKRENAPYKMVNSYGPGPRATRRYYTRIYSVAKEKADESSLRVGVETTK